MQKMSTKTLYLNRDPVCAADDVDEHKRVLVIPADMTVKDFIWMLRNDYLWDVWRGKWTALAGETEVKESFNLYREGRLSKIFKIRNRQ